MRRMAYEFTQQGMPVTVISPRTGESPSHGDFGEQIVPVANLPGIPARFRAVAQSLVWFSTARAVRCLELEIDVVLLLASLTSALGVRTALLKGLGHKPVVVYVTGLGRPRFGFRWGLSADRILVGSEFLHEWLPGAGVVYPFLPHGFELHSRNTDGQDRMFKVLFLGSLEPERGVEYLLQAMAIVKEHLDGRAKLIIAWNGEGAYNYRSIQRLIDTLNIRPIVDWRGRVNTGQLYNESDVVVIPRVSQERMSLPIRIVESIHMQKPMIVSRICGMEHQIRGCGLVVEPRDAKGLARAILDLARNPALQEQFSAKCLEAAQEYDAHVSLNRLVDELRMACGNV